MLLTMVTQNWLESILHTKLGSWQRDTLQNAWKLELFPFFSPYVSFSMSSATFVARTAKLNVLKNSRTTMKKENLLGRFRKFALNYQTCRNSIRTPIVPRREWFEDNATHYKRSRSSLVFLGWEILRQFLSSYCHHISYIRGLSAKTTFKNTE